MSVEERAAVGQLLRLNAGGVHISRWTAYEPYVAEGAAFQRLKDSIMFMSGNLQPIGVRRVGHWPEGWQGSYELLFGHLRLQACRELGIPVLAVFDEIGDRELLVHFTAEHREKLESFPWRFGTACHQALQEGLYPAAVASSAATHSAPHVGFNRCSRASVTRVLIALSIRFWLSRCCS